MSLPFVLQLRKLKFRDLLESMQPLLSGAQGLSLALVRVRRTMPHPHPASPSPSLLPFLCKCRCWGLAHQDFDQGHLAQALKSSFFSRAVSSHFSFSQNKKTTPLISTHPAPATGVVGNTSPVAPESSICHRVGIARHKSVLAFWDPIAICRLLWNHFRAL